MRWLLHIALLLCIFLIPGRTKAQDVHFSQHFYAPQNINPAYTGFFRGNHRFTANYKNQWPGVKVPYNTISLAWDGKVIPMGKRRTNWFSMGFTLYRDAAGDSKFQTIDAQFSIAYNHAISDRHYISAGVGTGIVNRGFKIGGLNFDNQWNGDVFDPTVPINETFDRTRFNFFDLSLGIAYAFRPERGKTIEFGYSSQHLNEPNQSYFTNRETTLNVNYILQLKMDWAIGRSWSILPSIMYQRQDSKSETIFGTNVGVMLRPATGQDIRFLMGFHYRIDDAMIGLLGFESGNFRSAITYDMNMSGLNTASNLRGGVELSATYFIRKVPKFRYQGPSCPVF